MLEDCGHMLQHNLSTRRKQSRQAVRFGILCLLCTLFLLASPAASSAGQRVVTIFFTTLSLPYADETINAGFEVDLARAVFARRGITVQAVFMPKDRAAERLAAGKAQGMVPVRVDRAEDMLFESRPYVAYQNVYLHHAHSPCTVRKLEDIFKGHLVAFHMAGKYLGQDFVRLASASPSYEELVDQNAQVRRFLIRKDCSIVIDQNIYEHLVTRLNLTGEVGDVCLHSFFHNPQRTFVFVSNELRQLFNEGLREVMRDGTYQRLVNIYGIVPASAVMVE
jgi:polar amino acid transport system substrate-binding protein